MASSQAAKLPLPNLPRSAKAAIKSNQVIGGTDVKTDFCFNDFDADMAVPFTLDIQGTLLS
jgi:hypothetical protein